MPVNHCPNCGAPLSTYAPGGHCPRCLLLQGLESDAPGLADETPDETLDRTPRASSAAGDTVDLPPRAGSVLDSLGTTVDNMPHVSLRDTEPREPPSAVVRPASEADPTLRYRIDGEIARGGMGAVLKGRDPDLGRDVAIKVLHAKLHGDDDMVRRFVEEAQIGGQLQHPGVVPIYELGTFADRRPFFSMKLVRGQTLA